MVSVMVMTPIHMHHGQASLEMIGLVISVHVAGMFAFSPVHGVAGRPGRAIPVVIGGGVTLLVAVAFAGTSAAGHSAGLTSGCSCSGWAGRRAWSPARHWSPRRCRARTGRAAQGSSDLLMGLSAAAGGAVAGLVVGTLGYGVLNAMASVLAVALLAATAHPSVRSNGGTSAATRAD